jgi:predicted lysophospholipase L1 biosynthesis ABC-type transport system permease subunit
VWVARGAEERIKRALQDLGVTITRENRVEELVRRFNQQGPGLAMVLLLASAGLAALLAMARAAFGLYATRRRRTYELAALSVIGVPRRAPRGTLLIEQGITLGIGVLAGVVAGAVAASIALPRIPQFGIPPVTPPLTYTPDALVLGGIAVAAAIAVAVVTVFTSEAICRSMQVAQLREAPP